jgi:predicted phosphodiesterase
MNRRIALYIACLLAPMLFALAWESTVSTLHSRNHLRVTLTGGPMVQIGDTDGRTAMVIAWRTGQKSKGYIDYGPGNQYSYRITETEARVGHAVVLPRLQPNRRYHYRVVHGDRILAEAVFQTGKTADRSFRFVVFGDSGSGNGRQAHLADLIAKQKPDFILHTGDVVYWDGKDEDYPAKFYVPYRKLLERIPIFPVLGNHDVMTANGRAWLDNFVLPGNERYYRFDYRNASFIALDSNNVDAASARWLEKALINSKEPWKIVFFHIPPFSNKKGRQGNLQARKRWLPLFERYNVDLVFSGHDHMFTRYRRHKGIYYIVEGLGGYSIQEINPDAENVQITSNQEYGFGVVEIAGKRLTFKHVTEHGQLLDSLVVQK